jgi:hypothetical protein
VSETISRQKWDRPLIEGSDLTTWSDNSLLEARDFLAVQVLNLEDQKTAWERGDLIGGYDSEWAGRLRGAIAHSRRDQQSARTELRRRGLWEEHNPAPKEGSKRSAVRRMEFMTQAINEIAPPEIAEAITARSAALYASYLEARSAGADAREQSDV